MLGLGYRDVLFSTVYIQYTVELQSLEHLWNHKIYSTQGWFELKNVINGARSGGIIGIYFRFSLT